MGKKMMPLVAVVDGEISLVVYPQATWGYSVTIRDKDGYRYNYLHINNDTPGTDNGQGDGMFAYAPDVQSGNKVVKGQLIGWMGDSGNAETTPPHLHFEIRTPDGQPFSPYQSLKAAVRVTAPADYPALPNEILPYNSFPGGGTVALGNVDGDKDLEMVTGAGSSGGPLVKIFDPNKIAKASFYAYDSGFTGGVDVASGDIDKDGKAEIITAPASMGGPHVKIFKGDGTLLSEFLAYDSRWRGGVSVAAADLDNDGKAEIITGTGPGGGPHVKIFKANGTLMKEFFAYDSAFRGGIDVAAAKDGSGGVVITSPGAGGGPHVKVFSDKGSLRKEFFAYDPNFKTGLRISAGNVNTSSTEPEIVVVPASIGGPHFKTFSLEGRELTSELSVFEPWWRGGYDVAAGTGKMYVISNGGRRTSLREYKPGSSSGGDRFRDRTRQFFSNVVDGASALVEKLK
jgi:murein DD-endopeptidase MepM/ murein hydrolase activator NlpD